MAYKRKTWQEKLGWETMTDKVEVTTKKFADIPAGARMYISTPRIVDAYIRDIPFGCHSTLSQMRTDLAATHNADYCCPVTAGIFLRIVAEAAWEDMLAGKAPEDITPFWRIVDPGSVVAGKLSCGSEWLVARQAQEGIRWPRKTIRRK